MRRINDDKLCNITGGSSGLTSSMINAFTNIIKELFSAGHSLGSAIRRISEDSLCPLE